MKISDALLFDLLSVFKLKQIPLAIEILRGRLTFDDLMQMKFVHTAQARGRIEVRPLDEHNGGLR